MKRLYYLTNNIESTENIANDLHLEGVSDWNFHVLSKDEAGLYKRHIHSANYIHKLDIIRNAERGAIVGFGCAVLVTLYVVNTDTFGTGLSSLVYIAIFGFVTLFGAWLGGLTGLAQENQKVAQYHHDIESGKFLIMVDVRPGDEERVMEIMERRHPDAEFKRLGSTFINPFKFTRNVSASPVS